MTYRLNNHFITNPIIISHRGNGLTSDFYIIENTIYAFEQAFENNIKWVEMDLRRCKDSIIILHDHSLDRTTNASGNIYNLNLKQIKTLTNKVPSLIEVLEYFKNKNYKGSIHFNLELKDSNLIFEVLYILNCYIDSQTYKSEQFLISSFHHQQLHNIPNFNIGYIYDLTSLNHLNLNHLNSTYILNYEVLLQHHNSLNIIQNIHNQNSKIWVYTVNSNQEYNKLIDLGVDGIISDYTYTISSP